MYKYKNEINLKFLKGKFIFLCVGFVFYLFLEFILLFYNFEI